jgi:hypothetical protein
MAANATNPLPKYSITSIIPEADTNNPARIVPSHRVSFTADNGVSSSVLVPDTDIDNLGAVQSKVEAMITALSAIMRLGGK